MYLKNINKDNIVFNKVRLDDIINYVNINEKNLDIVKNIISNNNLKITSNLDSLILENNNKLIFGEKSANNFYSKSTSEIINDNVYEILSNSLTGGHNGKLLLTNKSILKTTGTIINTLSNYKSFGIERIEKNYLVDDPNTSKITSSLNQFKKYKQNTFQKTFYNFNTINFYSTNSTQYKGTNSTATIDNKTHKNVLCYPNLINNQGLKNYYIDEDCSLSFFINPRYKNFTSKGIFDFNPGCVINIPNFLSVYLIGDTEKDALGKIDSYRLLISTNNSASSNIDFQDIIEGIDFTDNNIQYNDNSDSVLTENKILKHNNWHNICISVSTNFNKTDKDIYIFIDGKLLNKYSVENFNYINKDSEDYICIGNRIRFDTGNYTDAVYKMFSVNKTEEEDLEGPFITKSIKIGKNTDNIFGTSLQEIYLNNTLNIDNNFVQQTSEALHAELHDIRIYNNSVIDERYSNNIYTKGIKDINEEKKNGLIFYVPVYYIPEVTAKRANLNLSGVTKTYKKNGKGIIVSDNNGQIYKDINIAYSSPINPYFYNFCGGYEINVENFLFEFISKTSPNVFFSFIDTDALIEYLYAVNTTLSSYDIKSLYKEISKKGFSANKFLEERLCFPKLNEEEDMEPISTFRILSAFFEKNNLILPNDNGLQYQYHDLIFNVFNEFSNSVYYKSENNQYNAAQVNLSTYLECDNKKLNITERESERYSEENGIISYFNTATPTSTYTTYDRYYDCSNLNYYNNLFTFTNNGSNIVYKKSESGDISFINISSGIKTFSNPFSRNYFDEDVYNNITDNNILYFKSINENENIAYKKYLLPEVSINKNETSPNILMFAISSQLFDNFITDNSIKLRDINFGSSGGEIDLKFSEHEGLIYRSNALTKNALYSKQGVSLNKEGLVFMMHPALFSFGNDMFNIQFNKSNSMFVNEVNIDALNINVSKSNNNSYLEDLRLDDSAFNKDEKFVYITDIFLHDENLNILAKVKLATPFAKKDSDNVRFRVKMDY